MFLFLKVELSEAQALCEIIPEIHFVMETSAKDNTNIETLFYSVANELKVNEFHLIYKKNILSNVNFTFLFWKISVAILA